MVSRKSVGIIAEYNPFHNGHQYHLQQSLEMSGAEISIAVISGNFTQRGEPALLDKWTRAETAVRNGVNLVVEMPFLFACNNAGYFARGGVEILENLGCDFISFGSESGNIALLQEISRETEAHRSEMEEAVKVGVKKGLTYPKARYEAVTALLGEEASEVLSTPNNLLALEYLRYMKSAKPITVKRQGSGYHDLTAKEDIASATGIRKMLAGGEDISRFASGITREILTKSSGRFADEDKLFPLLREKILLSSSEELNRIFGAEEGLGNKMKANVRYWKNMDELIEDLKSKRYTRTRITRLLAMTLLGVQREDVKNARNYIRVLAFDEKGSQYLKKIKKSEICSLPILTNINKEAEMHHEIKETLEKDILAGDLYNLTCGHDLYENSDYVKMPFRMERRQEIRRSGIAARDAMDKEERNRRSAIICEKIAEWDVFRRAQVVMIYKAVRGEVRLQRLEELMQEYGKTAVYPLCISKTEMIALYPSSDEAWEKGHYGILEPVREKSELILPEKIDLVICPCTVFDEEGNRMGMGAGYYDRFLPLCVNARIAAAAFECQKTEKVPADAWDRPMERVFTEC